MTRRCSGRALTQSGARLYTGTGLNAGSTGDWIISTSATILPRAPSPTASRAPWRREIVRDLVPVLVATRLLFLAITIALPLGRQALGLPPLILANKPADHATGTVLDSWNQYDTLWYNDIAYLGYNVRGPQGYKNVAFFPLFPLLMRSTHDGLAFVDTAARAVAGVPLNQQPDPPYLLIGLLVSNFCTAAMLAFFYCLVKLDHGRVAARRAAALLAISPVSFYLFAAYTESTYLLCAIACFYSLRVQRWLQAGLWGLLAAIARAPGAILVAPFLMAWAEAHPATVHTINLRLRRLGRLCMMRLRLARAWLSGKLVSPGRVAAPASDPSLVLPLRFSRGVGAGHGLYRRGGNLRRTAAISAWRPSDDVRGAAETNVEARPWPEEARWALRHVLPAIVMPLGLVLFMVFLYVLFGDALWFSHAQKAWWRTFAPPWETLYLSISAPLGYLLHGHYTPIGPAVHDLFYEIIGLALTWFAWRRLPRTQGVYLWLVWGVILCSPAMLSDQVTGESHTDVLMSLPRLLLMMFPLFTYIATTLNRRWYAALLVFFGGAVIVYTVIFLSGGWIA